MTNTLVPTALTLNLPGVLTQVSLELRPNIPYEQWEGIYRELSVMEKGVQWWLGDALNYGEKQYGEIYTQAIETTGLDYGTLANYKYVASRITFSRRREKLSFGHHQNVASLDSEQQALWLEQAENNKWSVMRLREEIEATKQPAPPPSLIGFQEETLTVDEVAENVFEALGALPEEKQVEVITKLVEAAEGDTVKSKRIKKAISEVVKKAAHVSHNSGEQEWYTPPEFILAARAVMGEIDLDPASSKKAQETVQAATYYTIEDDGLTKEWQGRTWMNPPYTAGLVDKFLAKLCRHYAEEDVPEAIVLVNNATETDWFQCAADHASAIGFPDGRVKFICPEGEKGAPLQGQALLYFGQNPELFKTHFQPFGFCVEVSA